jgi:autotransporter-associated beta strand protein
MFDVRCFFLLAFLALAPASFAAPPAGYYLVWSDEFNATSLDTTKWDYWLPGNRRNAVNVTNAVSLNGSNLVITTYTSNNTHYTAFVATDRTFRSRYGYWESSIKWGDRNGMWSAFWTQSPTMGTHLGDPQVSGSEIDMAEHRYVDGATNNIADQIQVNIHWNGYGSAAKSTSSGNVGSGLAGGFHTYGFLWTANSYSFQIDGSQVYNGGSSPVSHSTEWVILSSEVDDTSTTWAGFIPAGGYGDLGTSAAKLTVDYVRYYAPTNVLFWTGASSATWTDSANWISNLPPTPASDLTFSYLSGNNLATTPGQDYSIDGLVFLNLNNGVIINGTNMLTIGAGGVDMVAANHNVTISTPVIIGAAQTWFVGSNHPGNTLNLNGSLSGTSALSKGGYGTLILNGTNSFSGALNVDTGTLLVNGSLGAAKVTVSGGTLGGNGVINGPVTVQPGGRLAPGNPIGVLAISNSLALGGTTFIDLNKSAATNDVVRGMSTITYGGTLMVTNLGGTLAAGDRFKLFDAGSYSGAFASLSPARPGPGLVWNTNTLATDGSLRIAAAAPPAINTVAQSGNRFRLNIAGRPPGSPFRVLASTNLILPLTNWILARTGTFDFFSSGQFTSPFSLSTPQQFFNIVMP